MRVRRKEDGLLLSCEREREKGAQSTTFDRGVMQPGGTQLVQAWAAWGGRKGCSKEG